MLNSSPRIAMAPPTDDFTRRPGRRSTIAQGVGLFLFVTICFVMGGIGSFITNLSLRDWYPTLAKPMWTPPGWVFGVVWSALYALMGCAAWLVWRGRLGDTRLPLAWFALQLVLNVGWSGVFFGLRAPAMALVELVFLWVSVVVTTIFFWRRSTAAGLLMTPYVAWSTFALFLNFAIWRMNEWQ